MGIRLVIANDHPHVLQLQQDLFESHADITIAATCSDDAGAIEAVWTHRPDVLLLDLRRPRAQGLSVIRQMRQAGLQCRALLLTDGLTDAEMVEAIEMDVAGLVLRDGTPGDLVESIRRVARGHSWFGGAVLDGGTGHGPQHAQPPALTAREVELVRLAAKGLRNTEIATQLGLTEGTVMIHLHSVYDKLGVDSRPALVRTAQHRHLI
jgi:DNA-binding NarL/FixJ family response regulator